MSSSRHVTKAWLRTWVIRANAAKKELVRRLEEDARTLRRAAEERESLLAKVDAIGTSHQELESRVEDLELAVTTALGE